MEIPNRVYPEDRGDEVGNDDHARVASSALLFPASCPSRDRHACYRCGSFELSLSLVSMLWWIGGAPSVELLNGRRLSTDRYDGRAILCYWKYLRPQPFIVQGILYSAPKPGSIQTARVGLDSVWPHGRLRPSPRVGNGIQISHLGERNPGRRIRESIRGANDTSIRQNTLSSVDSEVSGL